MGGGRPHGADGEGRELCLFVGLGGGGACQMRSLFVALGQLGKLRGVGAKAILTYLWRAAKKVRGSHAWLGVKQQTARGAGVRGRGDAWAKD
jgi:hypothetical protein